MGSRHHTGWDRVEHGVGGGPVIRDGELYRRDLGTRESSSYIKDH